MSVESYETLSVVPVVVNAGAALLPAIVAGLTSVVSVILKPKELARVFRTKPHIPLLVIAVGAGLYFGTTWLFSPKQAEAQTRENKQTAAAGQKDWSTVALEMVKQEDRNLAEQLLRERAAREKLQKENEELKAKLTALMSGAPIQSAAVPANDQAPVQTDAAGAQVQEPQPAVASGPGKALGFRGDSSRCGFDGGKSPRQLADLWEYYEEDVMYLSSPLVVGDRVYGGSCLLDPGRNYGAMFCLDANTGRKRWVTDIYIDAKTGKEKDLKGFFSSPAITADGKSVVVGQGLHVDADCSLLCFDAETGALRWMIPTPLHIEGSPAIDGDLAVAGAGAIEGDDRQPKGNPGFVLAVRISTGEKLWEYPVADPESSPVIADGVAYIGSGFNGSAVVALRTETDQELKAQGKDRLKWRTPTPHPATGAITMVDDLVLVGVGNGDYVFSAPDPDGAVIAIDRETGKIRWQAKMADAVLGPVAVRDGVAICPVRNGEIVALDIKDGKKLWGSKLPKDALAGTAFTGKYVYAVTKDGNLWVMDAANGKTLEKKFVNRTPGEMGLSVSSPFVANGMVYVGSETGGVRCLMGKELD